MSSDDTPDSTSNDVADTPEVSTVLPGSPLAGLSVEEVLVVAEELNARLRACHSTCPIRLAARRRSI